MHSKDRTHLGFISLDKALFLLLIKYVLSLKKKQASEIFINNVIKKVGSTQ